MGFRESPQKNLVEIGFFFVRPNLHSFVCISGNYGLLSNGIPIIFEWDFVL